MPPEMIIVPAVFAIPAAVLFARMWFRHKEKMTALSGGSHHGLGQPALEARLDRIEHAVEAIAIEIERMGEGQRFVTRLLSERAVASEFGAAGTPIPVALASGQGNSPR